MPVPHRTKLRAWLQDVADETAEAARKALRGKDPHRTVKLGATGAPTSLLDDYAERVILRRLADAPIGLNLLSEEIGVVERNGDWWLLADPVDGTRNALRGIPFYAVSLAVARKDLSTVEMGIVRSIPTESVYWAEKGRGATHNGRRLRVRPYNRAEVVAGIAIDHQEDFDLPGGDRLHFRDLGSAALEMCLVAQGSLDAFYVPQPLTRLIDVAASTLLVREAGGQVYHPDGRKLNVPLRANLRFPLVAVNDDRVLEELR